MLTQPGLLPPLFLFVREDYGVSYTQLGLALTAFNVISAVLQTPAGFLVDRYSARIVLIVGLLLGAFAFLLAGLVNSFWVFVLMFAVAGIGNTVYHPADYALLSRHVAPERMGQAFSIHTFSGILGGAVAPASLLLMQSFWGWRGAFIGASLLGLVAAALLAVQRDAPAAAPMSARAKQETAAADASGWQLLMTTPILGNLAFFVLLSVTNGGLQNYSVVALGALYGTSPIVANTALTGYLVLSAIGVLLGGLLLSRSKRYALIAAIGLAVTGLAAVLVGSFPFGTIVLLALMSVGGLFQGIVMPSRDMLVREVTPPGAFGKVFGFVTTGFNIGGVISPLIFGAVLDHGAPQAVFLLVGVCAVLAITLVAVLARARTH